MKLSIVGHFRHRDEADAHPAKLTVAAVDEFRKLRLVGAALGRMFDFVAGAVVDSDFLVLTHDKSAPVLLDCPAGRDKAAQLVSASDNDCRLRRAPEKYRTRIFRDLAQEEADVAFVSTKVAQVSPGHYEWS